MAFIEAFALGEPVPEEPVAPLPRVVGQTEEDGDPKRLLESLGARKLLAPFQGGAPHDLAVGCVLHN